MKKQQRFWFDSVVERASNAFFGMFGLNGLNYQSVAGQKIAVPYEVTVFERGDAAAILLVDLSRRCFVVLRNTRIGWALGNIRRHHVDCTVNEGKFVVQDLGKLSGRVFDLLAPQSQLIEIIAGTLDRRIGPEVLVRQEVLEEAGYKQVVNIQSLGIYVSSPGASTEIVYLFSGCVLGVKEPEQRAALEDGIVTFVPFDQSWPMIQRGEIVDGKTVVAILKYVRMNPDLFENW